MKFYFVGAGVLNSAQLDRLHYAGVPVSDSTAPRWLSSKLPSRPGFAFAEEHFQKMLEVLGGRVIKTAVLDKFDDQQLVEPKLIFDKTPAPVVMADSNLPKGEEALLRVLRKRLLPRSKSDIILRYAGGTEVDTTNAVSPIFSYHKTGKFPPPPSSPLYIYLWGAPKGSRKQPRTQGYRLWTVDIPPTCPITPVQSTHGKLLFDFYNTAIGQLNGNVACCYFDLLMAALPVYHAEIIFDFFAEDLAELLFGNPKSQFEHAELRRQQRDEFFRKNFAAVGLQGYTHSLNQQRRRLAEATEKIASLDADLRRAIMQREGALRAIAGIESDAEEGSKNIDQQYDLLRANKKVTDVIVHPGVIEVRTSYLYCKHRDTGEWHELGEMAIHIYTHPATKPPFVVENLTRRIKGVTEGMHHPHVFADGHLCMGSYERTMIEYLATHDYSSLVGLIIYFLETHTPGDAAGKYLGNWPKLSPAKTNALIKDGTLSAPK